MKRTTIAQAVGMLLAKGMFWCVAFVLTVVIATLGVWALLTLWFGLPL